MDVVTYSLRNGQKRSDHYYQDIAAFTDEVLAEANARLHHMAGSFQAYQQQNGHILSCTFAEYAFELLTLGILWQVYGDSRKPALDTFDQLLARLAAANDFDEEVARLRPWRDFLAEQPPEKSAGYITAVLALANWFEGRSLAVIGRYTPHVERFLTETYPGYKGREDEILCGRRRVEYHLNMVGTEILTRAYQSSFRATARRVVIAPPCMRAKPEAECQARCTGFGAYCTGCTPACRVHQLTKLGAKHGFEVIIFTHDLPSLCAGLDGGEKFGVVGISCVLTNAPGGWQAKTLGIPAQGVLLDYCGCSWHWHETGIPTDANFKQLLRLLTPAIEDGTEGFTSGIDGPSEGG